MLTFENCLFSLENEAASEENEEWEWNSEFWAWEGVGVLTTYHHAACKRDTSSTVSVGNYIPITYTQEGNSDQPHGV